ncbi:hypothetical protein COLO4_20484 [Corchorus olitorius]|uniref:Uncharacterized protein n=1 Tax=Corchorus olitorius TaxID=93759 RepID=A0A1R3IZR3_9ROSI|nr:hypothetical protein COLO4_20484 [Corchorus olitorius]
MGSSLSFLNPRRAISYAMCTFAPAGACYFGQRSRFLVNLRERHKFAVWQVALTGVVFGGFSCAFLHYFEINRKRFSKIGPRFMIGLCCFLAGTGLLILHDVVNGNSPNENGLLGLAFAALFLWGVKISVAPGRDLPLAPVILRFLVTSIYFCGAGIALPILPDTVNGNSPDEYGLLGLAFAALFLLGVEISVAPGSDLPLAPVILRFLVTSSYFCGVGIGQPILHDAVHGNSPDENVLLGLAFAALFLWGVEISVAPGRDLPLAPVILHFLVTSSYFCGGGFLNKYFIFSILLALCYIFGNHFKNFWVDVPQRQTEIIEGSGSEKEGSENEVGDGA